MLPSLAKQVPLEKYLTYARSKTKEKILKENPEIKISQEFSFSVAQQPALAYLFEGKWNALSETIFGEEVVCRDENFLYHFRFWSKSTEWDLLRPIYLKILEGFQPYYKIESAIKDTEKKEESTSSSKQFSISDKPQRTLHYFCYSLTVPKDWEEISETYYLVQFLLPRNLNQEKITKVPVVGEFQIHKIQDPQKALQWWLQNRMRPLSKYDYMDPEKKPTLSKVSSFKQWKQENGFQLASICVDEYHDAVTCTGKACNHIISKLFGFLYWNEECAFFTGSAFGSMLEENNEKNRGKNRFEVRGVSAEDLWLVVYHKTGLSTFHRLEPTAKKRWGGLYEPTGFAIDDLVEGRYEVGNNYKIYNPPK